MGRFLDTTTMYLGSSKVLSDSYRCKSIRQTHFLTYKSSYQFLPTNVSLTVFWLTHFLFKCCFSRPTCILCPWTGTDTSAAVPQTYTQRCVTILGQASVWVSASQHFSCELPRQHPALHYHSITSLWVPTLSCELPWQCTAFCNHCNTWLCVNLQPCRTLSAETKLYFFPPRISASSEHKRNIKYLLDKWY